MPTKRKIRIDDCDDGPEQKRARWLCSVDACTSYAVIEGVCNMHRLEKMSRTRCSIGGCKNPIAGCPDLAKMGVCWFHGENQARPRGDVVKPPTVGSAGMISGFNVFRAEQLGVNSQKEIGKRWKNMSEEEQLPYKDKASEENERRKKHICQKKPQQIIPAERCSKRERKPKNIFDNSGSLPKSRAKRTRWAVGPGPIGVDIAETADGKCTCAKCHSKKVKCDGSRPYCLRNKANRGGSRSKKREGDSDEASACSEEEEDEGSGDGGSDDSKDEAPARLPPVVACPVCRSKKVKCNGERPYCLRTKQIEGGLNEPSPYKRSLQKSRSKAYLRNRQQVRRLLLPELSPTRVSSSKASDLTVPAHSASRHLTVAVGPGPIGVDIAKTSYGRCIVRKKTDEGSPLHVGDVIISLNGEELTSMGGLTEWVRRFRLASNAPNRTLVVQPGVACAKCHSKKVKCDGSRPYCLRNKANRGGSRSKKREGDSDEATACSKEEQDEGSGDGGSLKSLGNALLACLSNEAAFARGR